MLRPVAAFVMWTFAVFPVGKSLGNPMTCIALWAQLRYRHPGYRAWMDLR